MKKRLPFLIAGLVIIAGLTGFFILRGNQNKETNLIVPVKKSDFEIAVSASGELEAKNSVRIMGPGGLISVQIWQVKISDLVPEGTVVKKGDYVARLDETEIGNKLKDASAELQKAEAQFTQNQLDTALNLRSARDEINNENFAVKEKEIVVEQSKYEPPATIRQAEIELEKAKRKLLQSKENYRLKRNQAIAKMNEVSVSLSQVKEKLNRLTSLSQTFTITAPESGMVIYEKDWDGRKKVVGSQIWAGDPSVATLPDMSIMISKTYVNEVDIRKIKKDQLVKIGLDAFPEKKLSGVVIAVANVGEQRPNSDAKVFEVKIQVNEKDTILRPAMTTSNNIVAGVIKNVLHIPLECLHTQGDSLTYVYKKEGTSFLKKQVRTAQSNENEVVITEGLSENEEVYLSVPQEADKQKIILLPNPKKVTAQK
jgi:multidrug efflux pump subunit AcrA (membrane-fusion protein)